MLEIFVINLTNLDSMGIFVVPLKFFKTQGFNSHQGQSLWAILKFSISSRDQSHNSLRGVW